MNDAEVFAQLLSVRAPFFSSLTDSEKIRLLINQSTDTAQEWMMRKLRTEPLAAGRPLTWIEALRLRRSLSAVWFASNSYE